jgi:hypothetical protein
VRESQCTRDRRRHASLDPTQGAGPLDAARGAVRPDESVGGHRSGEGLQDFKAWLRREVVIENFTNADDLGRKIALTLAKVPTISAAASSRGPAPVPPRPHCASSTRCSRHHISMAATTWCTRSRRGSMTRPRPTASMRWWRPGGPVKPPSPKVVARLQERWPPPARAACWCGRSTKSPTPTPSYGRVLSSSRRIRRRARGGGASSGCSGA